MNTLSKIKDMLLAARDIAVYCHTNPDGDTLACALALRRALAARGKTVTVFCDDKVPERYAFFEGAESVSLPEKRTHELALAVDCSDLARVGGAGKSFLSAKKRAVIDHHKSHIAFGDADCVREDAAACAEIVFDLLRDADMLDDGVAALIFGGIVADTGCFQYPSTTARTHEIASELMKFDFDSSDIIYRIHRKIRPEVFALKYRALSGCKFFDGGKIAVITFRLADFEATNTQPADTEGIVTAAINIAGVEVAFAVSEVKDKNFKVSIRTKDAADAADIADAFGGGGHKNAAGCRLSGFYEDVVDKLLKAARDRM